MRLMVGYPCDWLILSRYLVRRWHSDLLTGKFSSRI